MLEYLCELRECSEELNSDIAVVWGYIKTSNYSDRTTYAIDRINRNLTWLGAVGNHVQAEFEELNQLIDKER